MNTKHLERIYNEMPYQVKDNIGFPDAYIFLTNDQELFIMELFENEINYAEEEKEALKTPLKVADM